MAYISTEFGFDHSVRSTRLNGVAALQRLTRRLAALQRKARRDRHVWCMRTGYDANLLADTGVAPRAQRYDWLGALMAAAR